MEDGPYQCREGVTRAGPRRPAPRRSRQSLPRHNPGRRVRLHPKMTDNITKFFMNLVNFSASYSTALCRLLIPPSNVFCRSVKLRLSSPLKATNIKFMNRRR